MLSDHTWFVRTPPQSCVIPNERWRGKKLPKTVCNYTHSPTGNRNEKYKKLHINRKQHNTLGELKSFFQEWLYYLKKWNKIILTEIYLSFKPQTYMRVCKKFHGGRVSSWVDHRAESEQGPVFSLWLLRVFLSVPLLIQSVLFTAEELNFQVFAVPKKNNQKKTQTTETKRWRRNILGQPQKI